MLITPAAGIRSAEITDKPRYVNRRTFIASVTRATWLWLKHEGRWRVWLWFPLGTPREAPAEEIDAWERGPPVPAGARPLPLFLQSAPSPNLRPPSPRGCFLFSRRYRLVADGERP